MIEKEIDIMGRNLDKVIIKSKKQLKYLFQKSNTHLHNQKFDPMSKGIHSNKSKRKNVLKIQKSRSRNDNLMKNKKKPPKKISLFPISTKQPTVVWREINPWKENYSKKIERKTIKKTIYARNKSKEQIKEAENVNKEA